MSIPVHMHLGAHLVQAAEVCISCFCRTCCWCDSFPVWVVRAACKFCRLQQQPPLPLRAQAICAAARTICSLSYICPHKWPMPVVCSVTFCARFLSLVQTRTATVHGCCTSLWNAIPRGRLCTQCAGCARCLYHRKYWDPVSSLNLFYVWSSLGVYGQMRMPPETGMSCVVVHFVVLSGGHGFRGSIREQICMQWPCSAHAVPRCPPSVCFKVRNCQSHHKNFAWRLWLQQSIQRYTICLVCRTQVLWEQLGLTCECDPNLTNGCSCGACFALHTNTDKGPSLTASLLGSHSSCDCRCWASGVPWDMFVRQVGRSVSVVLRPVDCMRFLVSTCLPLGRVPGDRLRPIYVGDTVMLGG